MIVLLLQMFCFGVFVFSLGFIAGIYEGKSLQRSIDEIDEPEEPQIFGDKKYRVPEGAERPPLSADEIESYYDGD